MPAEIWPRHSTYCGWCSCILPPGPPSARLLQPVKLLRPGMRAGSEGKVLVECNALSGRTLHLSRRTALQLFPDLEDRLASDLSVRHPITLVDDEGGSQEEWSASHMVSHAVLASLWHVQCTAGGLRQCYSRSGFLQLAHCCIPEVTFVQKSPGCQCPLQECSSAGVWHAQPTVVRCAARPASRGRVGDAF